MAATTKTPIVELDSVIVGKDYLVLSHYSRHNRPTILVLQDKTSGEKLFVKITDYLDDLTSHLPLPFDIKICCEEKIYHFQVGISS